VEELSPVIRASVTAAIRRRRGRAQRAFSQEVEDLVQSVLFVLFVKDGGRALLQWDPSRGLDLEGYVGLLAARETMSVLRSRRRNPWTEEPVVDDDAVEETPASIAGPESLTGHHHLMLAVTREVRARVSPLGFQLFDLLFLQGLPAEEVGARAGLGLPAVYTWSSRLVRLAQEIGADLARERPLNRSPARLPALPAPRAPLPSASAAPPDRPARAAASARPRAPRSRRRGSRCSPEA
jgi:RNA polymerase sigma-70 factor (ECF subfamily)